MSWSLAMSTLGPCGPSGRKTVIVDRIRPLFVANRRCSVSSCATSGIVRAERASRTTSDCHRPRPMQRTDWRQATRAPHSSSPNVCVYVPVSATSARISFQRVAKSAPRGCFSAKYVASQACASSRSTAELLPGSSSGADSASAGSPEWGQDIRWHLRQWSANIPAGSRYVVG
jgi:hypothetical protein